MGSEGLHDRLQIALGEYTYRQLAEITSTNAETVRRYMQGQSPAAEFLAALCGAFKLSGDWLLTGRGPMRTTEAKSHALAKADPGELMSAVAGNLERIMERVDRLEKYVQGLDIRVRARGEIGHGQGTDGEASESIARLRAALAQRPRPSDR